MAIFLVERTDSEKLTLVRAKSQSAAISRMADGIFKARTISNPSEVAEIMAKGTEFIDAIESSAAQVPPSDGGEEG